MKKIKVLNKWGLDEKTKKILSKECFFTSEYMQDNTLFYEIKNKDGEIVRIFPERIKINTN